MEAEAMSAKPAAAKSEAKAPEKMDPAGLEFFEKNVRPIFSEHCYKCHSAAEGASKGGLIMDSRAALLAGGRPGLLAAVAGQADQGIGARQRLQFLGIERRPLRQVVDARERRLPARGHQALRLGMSSRL